jgi:hypothetical protein
MSQKRRETIYLLRIWREPSELAAPGEWRGLLRSTDGRRQGFFRSAEELWKLLLNSETEPQSLTDSAETSFERGSHRPTPQQPQPPEA